MSENAELDIDLLGDADPDVRIRAGLALGTARAVEAAGPLVRRLGVEPRHEVRETLTWAVLRVAVPARPHLHAALTSDHWLARLQACHVLSKWGDPADTDVLPKVIDDPVDAVASRAWWAAGRIGSARLVPALVSQLGRGDSGLRNFLSIALAEFGEAAVPDLVAALRTDLGAGSRRHAADTLGLIGSPAARPAAPALVEAVDDEDVDVRLAALNALADLRSPLAGDAVARAASSRERRVTALAHRLGPVVTAHQAGVGTEQSEDPLRRLRSLTGAPVLRCRDALREAGGDVALAESLLTRGSAAPRPPIKDTSPPAGLVAAGPGTLVELTCESTYVADGRRFAGLARQIVELAATMPGCGRAGLLAAPLDDGTVADALDALSAGTGEGVALVSVTGPADAEVLGRKIAHQVAACAPRYLVVGDVPDSDWQAVRSAAAAGARGKPGGSPTSRRRPSSWNR